MGERERLFVALKAPPYLLANLTALQRGLDRRLPRRAMRWTPPDQLHLTLLFLGQVASARLPELVARLDRAVAGSCALNLELEGIGAFPNEHHPRIVWVGVGGALPGLNLLQERVALAGGPFVERPEERAFQPHLTLGRVGRNPQDVQAVANLFTSNRPARIGGWSATELVLVRSQLNPEGSVYTDLASFALGAVQAH